MKVTGFWSDLVRHSNRFELITQIEGYNITAYNEAGYRIWTHSTPQGMWYLRASALPDGTIAVIGQPHNTPDGMQCLIHYPDGSHKFIVIKDAFLWAQNGAIIEPETDDSWHIAVQVTPSQWRDVFLHRDGGHLVGPSKSLPLWPGGDGTSSQGFLQWLNHEVVWSDPNRYRNINGEVIILGVTDKDCWAGQKQDVDGLAVRCPDGVWRHVHPEALAFEPRILVDDQGRMGLCSRSLHGLVIWSIVPAPYTLPLLHPPAQPVTAIATFPRKMWLGYYKTMGRVGDYTQETLNLGVNVGMPGIGECDTSLSYEEKVAQYHKAARETVAANGSLVVEFSKENIDLARPYWHRVSTVLISTAYDTQVAEVEQKVVECDALLREYGLPRRPVAWYVDGALTDKFRRAKGVQLQALNLYIGPNSPTKPADAVKALRASYAQQTARLDSLSSAPIGIILVAQAYDRNGVWQNIDALMDMQPVYADFVHQDHRVLDIWWFSYGRKGGSLDHPELIEWHKSILRANPGTPDIVTIPWPTPPEPPEEPMQPYNEDLVKQTNVKVKDLYAQANRGVDEQYPVWIARTVYDYCAGMSWADSEKKHLAECAEALGL